MKDNKIPKIDTFEANGGQEVKMNKSAGNPTPDRPGAKSEKAWSWYGKDPGSYGKDAKLDDGR